VLFTTTTKVSHLAANNPNGEEKNSLQQLLLFMFVGKANTFSKASHESLSRSIIETSKQAIDPPIDPSIGSLKPLEHHRPDG
jgi:hypothetical protein